MQSMELRCIHVQIAPALIGMLSNFQHTHTCTRTHVNIATPCMSRLCREDTHSPPKFNVSQCTYILTQSPAQNTWKLTHTIHVILWEETDLWCGDNIINAKQYGVILYNNLHCIQHLAVSV